MSVTDVVIIGGGPAGSVAASCLRQKGLSVIVLEKAVFPRFHLGESLLPQSLEILEQIGALAKVEQRFLRKYGARFHDDIRSKKDRFSFDAAWKTTSSDGTAKTPRDHAFQVPRDELDALLLDHARELGADVRERWTATKLRKTSDDAPVSGVFATDPEGVLRTIEARFVIDASGRDALTAHASRSTSKIDGLDQTAIYAHFEGIPRQAGDLAGDIDIVLFASQACAGFGAEPQVKMRPNWFWFIPFKDGRTSVGAVVSRAWIQQAASSSTNDLFDRAVSESATARALLADARCLWTKKEAAADFSYRVGAMSGPGWLAVGDAGGFIDPLFSTGVHLAMSGASLAADAIAAILSSPDASSERAILAAWEERVRRAAETFILAVESFYRGPLVDYLFMEEKHAAIRRSITSLLAGDVFGDGVWLRDTRLRLKEMTR